MTGTERLRVLLELIAGAERSLKMLMYMFNPDHAGDVVRDALVEAARERGRGQAADRWLRVGSCPTNSSPSLTKAAGEYCVFNPTFGRRYLLRNHQKLRRRRRPHRHHRRCQHRRHLYDRTTDPNTGATCGSASKDRRRDAEPLFRHALPLVEPRRARSSVRSAACSGNIASGADCCSGSSAGL